MSAFPAAFSTRVKSEVQVLSVFLSTTCNNLQPGKIPGGPKFGLGNRPTMWTGYRARPPGSGYPLRGWHFDPEQVMN
jgi:hypothetical protein